MRASPPPPPTAGPDELARLRDENERLRAEVRELYARLAEVREVQRSLETLIVAGVAALEAVDRLSPRREPTTPQSPALLSWLRGAILRKADQA